jgi:hypothetical protein
VPAQDVVSMVRKSVLSAGISLRGHSEQFTFRLTQPPCPIFHVWVGDRLTTLFNQNVAQTFHGNFFVKKVAENLCSVCFFN